MIPDSLWYECRTAWRGLRSTPGPVLAAILTLAVAIGMNLAMFGVVDRALFSAPAHVRDAGRVFTLAFQRDDDDRSVMTTTSYVRFREIARDVPALEATAAFQPVSTSVVIAGEQLHADAMLVSGTFFEVLGAPARFGRALVPEDDTAAAPVAVVSHAFWMSALGASREAIGRRMTVRGAEYTIAGVMPANFSGHSTANVDLWLPLAAAMSGTPGWDRNPYLNLVAIVARVKEGFPAEAAASQASAASGRRVTLSRIGAGAGVSTAERSIALWLSGVAALVFVIGLANTATLLLVRRARRERDLAIRAALGASRRRLLLAALVESVILSAVAAVSSLLLAWWLQEAVRRLLLPGIAAWDDLPPRTIGAAALAAIIAATVSAVVAAPGVRPRRTTDPVLRGGRGGGRRVHRTLLLVQTVLSVVLLTGTGLFARSLHTLASQDLGLRVDGVMIVDFEPQPGEVSGQAALFTAAVDRLRRAPGVERVTPIGSIPFGSHHIPPIGVPGRAEPPSVDGQLPFLNVATPEFFAILGIRIVEGRPFRDSDERGAPVVVVNQTMARQVWPGESALGKCFRLGFDPAFDPSAADGPPMPPATLPCREVIGVAKDVRQRSVIPTGSEDRLMQYYVPFSQVPPPPGGIAAGPGVQGLMLRVSGDPDALAPAIRRLVVGARTDLPFLRVRPFAALLDRQTRPWRLGTALFGLFGALALAVGAIGMYAAFAHGVAERRREMAIRLALGARRDRVIKMVLGESLRLAAAGCIAGCAAAAIAGRWLQSLLFGTASGDPTVLAAAAAIMLAVAAAATALPAWSASRVDPNAALRAE